MSASPILFPAPVVEAWISPAQVTKLTGWTTRWLAQQVAQGKIRSRETETKLPNGRFAREYAVATLPADARAQHAAALSALAKLIPAAPQQTELPLFGGPHLMTAPRVRAPKKNETEVQARYRILQPILDMKVPHARATYARLRTAAGKPVDSLNRMIEWQIEQEAAAGRAISRDTIYRWLRAHRDEGEAGLAARRRKDSGQSRFFQEHRDAGVLIANLHIGDGFEAPLSAQLCYEMLCAQHELVGLSQDELPSYKTVCRFLDRSMGALKAYARTGKKDFNEKFMPFLSRAMTERANQIWVSDTMIADVEVMNDCPAFGELGEPMRLRLTAIIDYRSRLMVGYAWCREGSSLSIGTALRHAVETHGPCELLYVDNGKDFRKVTRGAVSGFEREQDTDEEKENEYRRIERTGVLARLGIRATHCLPHRPQSKHIERFFRTVHLGFCKIWQTYTGGKPSERPDQTAALMAVHRRAVRRGDLAGSHHPLASEFVAAFAAWLPIYGNKRHTGRGMDGRSPFEVFRDERNPKQRPAPPPEALAQLLWEHKQARVRECQIRLNSQDYAARGVAQSRLLMDLQHAETPVTVAYDPLDPARIAVLDDDGRLLTMLESKRLTRMAPDDPETQRQIAEMQRTRATISREFKEERTAIVRAGKQLGVVHPRQLLAASPARPEAADLPIALSAPPSSSIVQRKPKFKPAPVAHAPLYAHDLAAAVLGRKGNK